MKYVFSDFYLLVGAADKETRTVGDAYRRMAGMMGIPVDPACLLFALRGLCSGGFVTVSPAEGLITADTPIAVTDTGKKAVAISGIQKLMGEVKAFNKNELKFCRLDRADSDGDWALDTESFTAISEDMMGRREIVHPLFELRDAGEGMLTMTIHHPNHSYSPYEDEEGEESEANPFDPDAAAYSDSVSVTGTAERIMAGMSDLVAAAHALLTEAPKTRKVGLHGADKSLVVTLARAASEQGIVLRMTVEQIRFNRQRFYGKRDSDLDYAQCGDPIILHEMNGAADFAALVLPCAVALPERLGEADFEAIAAVHQKLK